MTSSFIDVEEELLVDDTLPCVVNFKVVLRATPSSASVVEDEDEDELLFASN